MKLEVIGIAEDVIDRPTLHLVDELGAFDQPRLQDRMLYSPVGN
jgi:hypothetical protein